MKIAGGQWMTGTHTFPTKAKACAFIAAWRKAEDRADASAVLQRDGKPVREQGMVAA